jgi:hypothetical protein
LEEGVHDNKRAWLLTSVLRPASGIFGWVFAPGLAPSASALPCLSQWYSAGAPPTHLQQQTTTVTIWYKNLHNLDNGGYSSQDKSNAQDRPGSITQ